MSDISIVDLANMSDRDGAEKVTVIVSYQGTLCRPGFAINDTRQ